MSRGESFFLLDMLYGTKVIDLGFAITKFIDLGFAVAELSPEVPSCPLFDMALRTRCLRLERNKWLQENIGRLIMFGGLGR